MVVGALGQVCGEAPCCNELCVGEVLYVQLVHNRRAGDQGSIDRRSASRAQHMRRRSKHVIQ